MLHILKYVIRCKENFDLKCREDEDIVRGVLEIKFKILKNFFIIKFYLEKMSA